MSFVTFELRDGSSVDVYVDAILAVRDYDYPDTTHAMLVFGSSDAYYIVKGSRTETTKRIVEASQEAAAEATGTLLGSLDALAQGTYVHPTLSVPAPEGKILSLVEPKCDRCGKNGATMMPDEHELLCDECRE